ncbi:MAG: dihydroneopterin aldolase [Actinomycetes bacterium]
MTGLDRVALRGLRARGTHGVLAHERAEGQAFVVDVVLGLDTRLAASSDDLTDTVDYAALAEKVVALIEGAPVDLIETLADRIARTSLEDPRVAEVEVTVHKPEAPVPVPFDDVTVTIIRSRS